MEIIGTGILLAIEWYLAPIVFMGVVTVIGGLSYGICRIFGGCKE